MKKRTEGYLFSFHSSFLFSFSYFFDPFAFTFMSGIQDVTVGGANEPFYCLINTREKNGQLSFFHLSHFHPFVSEVS